MKKIKIFIGSSIDDLAYERRDIVSFIAELNNRYIDRGIYIEPYICEEKSSELRTEGSQVQHDRYIRDDADAMIFMFFQKAGQYTMRELQLAREVMLNKENDSCVFIYFKTIDNRISDSIEIKKAIDKISGEYAHYYKKFSESDTIKLELLQYLSSVLENDNTLSIVNGKVYIGNIEANDLVLNNVFAYQNNMELNQLRLKIVECEHQMQIHLNDKNWPEFERLVEVHKEKQRKYNELEIDILHMLQQLFKTTREQNPNPIRIRALSLLEEGDYSGALKLIPLETIESKAKALIEKKKIQDNSVKYEAHEILEDAETRIWSLRFDINNENVDNELLLTYDSVVGVAIIGGNIKILIEYVDLLIENNKKKKALEIAKIIESNLAHFDNIDLYSKYDTYNLLAELSNTPEEQEQYINKASASIVEYINNLDKKDIEKYVDICLRFSELVDEKTSLPYLLGAIELLENDASIIDQRKEKHWVVELYLYTAHAYEVLNDPKMYEFYLCKAKDHFSHLLIDFDEMKIRLNSQPKEKSLRDESALKNYLWIIRIYQDLYQLNSNRHGYEYMTQLLILAGLCLSFERIKGFAEYFGEAIRISKQNEGEYETLINSFVPEYRYCLLEFFKD